MDFELYEWVSGIPIPSLHSSIGRDSSFFPHEEFFRLINLNISFNELSDGSMWKSIDSMRQSQFLTHHLTTTIMKLAEDKKLIFLTTGRSYDKAIIMASHTGLYNLNWEPLYFLFRRPPRTTVWTYVQLVTRNFFPDELSIQKFVEASDFKGNFMLSPTIPDYKELLKPISLQSIPPEFRTFSIENAIYNEDTIRDLHRRYGLSLLSHADFSDLVNLSLRAAHFQPQLVVNRFSWKMNGFSTQMLIPFWSSKLSTDISGITHALVLGFRDSRDPSMSNSGGKFHVIPIDIIDLASAWLDVRLFGVVTLSWLTKLFPASQSQHTSLITDSSHHFPQESLLHFLGNSTTTTPNYPLPDFDNLLGPSTSHGLPGENIAPFPNTYDPNPFPFDSTKFPSTLGQLGVPSNFVASNSVPHGFEFMQSPPFSNQTPNLANLTNLISSNSAAMNLGSSLSSNLSSNLNSLFPNLIGPNFSSMMPNNNSLPPSMNSTSSSGLSSNIGGLAPSLPTSISTSQTSPAVAPQRAWGNGASSSPSAAGSSSSLPLSVSSLPNSEVSSSQPSSTSTASTTSASLTVRKPVYSAAAQGVSTPSSTQVVASSTPVSTSTSTPAPAPAPTPAAAAPVVSTTPTVSTAVATPTTSSNRRHKGLVLSIVNKDNKWHGFISVTRKHERDLWEQVMKVAPETMRKLEKKDVATIVFQAIDAEEADGRPLTAENSITKLNEWKDREVTFEVEYSSKFSRYVAHHVKLDRK